MLRAAQNVDCLESIKIVFNKCLIKKKKNFFSFNLSKMQWNEEKADFKAKLFALLKQFPDIISSTIKNHSIFFINHIVLYILSKHRH